MYVKKGLLVLVLVLGAPFATRSREINRMIAYTYLRFVVILFSSSQWKNEKKVNSLFIYVDQNPSKIRNNMKHLLVISMRRI